MCFGRSSTDAGASQSSSTSAETAGPPPGTDRTSHGRPPSTGSLQVASVADGGHEAGTASARDAQMADREIVLDGVFGAHQAHGCGEFVGASAPRLRVRPRDWHRRVASMGRSVASWMKRTAAPTRAAAAARRATGIETATQARSVRQALLTLETLSKSQTYRATALAWRRRAESWARKMTMRKFQHQDQTPAHHTAR